MSDNTKKGAVCKLCGRAPTNPLDPRLPDEMWGCGDDKCARTNRTPSLALPQTLEAHENHVYLIYPVTRPEMIEQLIAKHGKRPGFLLYGSIGRSTEGSGLLWFPEAAATDRHYIARLRAYLGDAEYQTQLDTGEVVVVKLLEYDPSSETV